MLFTECDFNSEQIKDFYDTLNKTWKFQVEDEILAKINKIFTSYSSNDTERLMAIKYFWNKYSHWIDPHTAAAVVPWISWGFKNADDKQIVFLETSHVAQFSKELQDKWIVVPWMDEFDDTIKTMEQFKPQEWKDYLKTTWDFEDAFKQIKKAISTFVN
jgi:threonine synthase